MRLLTKLALAVLACLVLLVIVLVVIVPHCLSAENVLLSYADSTSGTKLWLEDNGSFDSAILLHVKRNGMEQRSYIIDKSQYGTWGFARDHDQFLVVNDEFIVAAYDMPSEKIIHYRELPFTIREGQGEIVALKKSARRAALRQDFPRKWQSASQPASNESASH